MTPPSSSTQTPQRGTGRGIGIRTAAGSDERALGQLHVYDGEGKGKSQAALGVVLRTIGLGICEQRRTRVLLLRFLKGPGRSYDDDAAIEAGWMPPAVRVRPRWPAPRSRRRWCPPHCGPAP